MAAPAYSTAAASTPHGDLAEMLPSLPLETRCPPFHLRHYNGFWQPEVVLAAAVPAIHAHFEPRPQDILLASFPKSGTTWLKALAFATMNRAMYSPFDAGHPLRRCNPHDCVRFLEAMSADEMVTIRQHNRTEEGAPSIPPAVLLSTHFPYSMLPESITGSRIVYICRNPKDVLVSGWLFSNKAPTAATVGVDMDVESSSYTLQEAFDHFCEGRCVNGPHWQHVLEYWEESLKRPDKVLFVRYEEMLREPVRNLRKIAEFMGCAFSKEEEEGGVVDAIVELCSLSELKGMEVNRNGSNYLAVKNEFYFRKGVIGDWSNHLTPEMAERLDKIVDDALQGSGSGLDLSPPAAVSD